MFFSCSPDFVSQINNTTCLSQILSLLEDSNSTISHQSLKLLHRLSLQKNFRPSFGSADGITIVFDLFKNEKNNLDKNILLSILCMCCKESVNRLKVRNTDILQYFLQSLEDDHYSQMHDKLISALQCFVFDETGISILLEHGLIRVLIKHLQRVAKFECTVPPVEDLVPTFMKDADMKRIMEHESQIFKSLYQLPFQKTSSHKKMTESIENISLKDEHETLQDEINYDDCVPKLKPVVYSIDSPTYKAHSDWNMKDESGEKCKQTFDRLDSDSEHGSSPLSTVSYNSPERCANGSPQNSKKFSFVVPSCSSWSDDESSPEPAKSALPGSTINKDPRYGMVCSIPYTCDSPVKFESQKELSPLGSPNSPRQEIIEYSSCESSDGETDDTWMVQEVPKDESKKEIIKNEVINLENKEITIISRCKPGISEFQEKGSVDKTEGNRKRDITEDDSEKYYPAKKKRLESPNPKNLSYRCLEIENQILILLSRLSQTTDPSPQLVNKEVVCCLLDYLNQVTNPEPRAARFLSRLASNPLCFDKLMRMNFIILVYYKLNLHTFEKDLFTLSKHRRCILQVSDVEKSIQSQKSGTEFSYTKTHKDPYSFLDIQDGNTDQDFNSLENKSTEKLISPEVKVKVTGQKEDKITFQAKVGMTLLQDMCIQADSHFGRGEIDRLMYKYPDEIKEWLPIEMCYISW